MTLLDDLVVLQVPVVQHFSVRRCGVVVTENDVSNRPPVVRDVPAAVGCKVQRSECESSVVDAACRKSVANRECAWVAICCVTEARCDLSEFREVDCLWCREVLVRAKVKVVLGR